MADFAIKVDPALELLRLGVAVLEELAREPRPDQVAVELGVLGHQLRPRTLLRDGMKFNPVPLDSMVHSSSSGPVQPPTHALSQT